MLCDVDETLGLDPNAVAAAITPKTKMVMPVHMCGSMADLNALKTICSKNNLILLEDACQAIGGTYNGKMLGTIGEIGCFSFDYVKTITCGEGGALITDSDTYAQHAHMYQDHGHDHVGADRGAESHPFIGYNYRLSEMNAAVGIAQLRKFDTIVDRQKEYFDLLKQGIQNVAGVTFRKVPEGGVESCSFLNFFLPTEDIARQTHKALVAGGIDATFYWFDNNWHYYREWKHFTNPTTLGTLPKETLQGLTQNTTSYPNSDQWVGRTVSCLIKGGWSKQEVQERAKQMQKIISECLENSIVA